MFDVFNVHGGVWLGLVSSVGVDGFLGVVHSEIAVGLAGISGGSPFLAGFIGEQVGDLFDFLDGHGVYFTGGIHGAMGLVLVDGRIQP